MTDTEVGTDYPRFPLQSLERNSDNKQLISSKYGSQRWVSL